MQRESNKLYEFSGAQLIINGRVPEGNILLYPGGFYASRCAENIKLRKEMQEGRVWVSLLS